MFNGEVLILAALALGCAATVARGQDAIVEAPITAADREHWAFTPLVRPEMPAVEDQGKWARTTIDRFVLARLEEKGIAPQGEAGSDTLVRRLSFDLTGLPPEDRGAGVPPAADGTRSVPATSSHDDYERLVDRLLAGPAYGERWAQHWLDLARFAETDGFEHDLVRPEAWKYRDWVIAALNADLPYDEFVRLQLAGDRVQGSGFRVQEEGGQSSEDRGQESENPKSEIPNLKSEIATMFCLAGPDMPDINSQEERRHYLLNEMTSTVGSVFMGLQVGCAQCHDHKYDPISQADFYRLRAFFESTVELKKDAQVSVLKENATTVESRLWVRGDFRQPGPLVSAAFPRIANPQDGAAPAENQRLALADWLTRPDHPLTSRVIANRLWQYHFGRGIVDSPSDFGLLGSSPTHPELLDWLATELVRCEWSIKTLHRRIVNSATYRQGSRVQSPKSKVQSLSDSRLGEDSGLGLYARFPRQRLSGETIRDAMLAAAGLLDRQRGGPGVMPPLPGELTSTLLKNQWKPSPREGDHYRRSVYLFARRNLRYPIFDTFDRPDANASCPARNVSTTALQSLQMVNSEFTLLCARHLAGQAESRGQRAESIEGERGISLRSTVSWLVRRVFGREATEGEAQLLEEFLQEQTDLLRGEGRNAGELALPIGTQADDLYAAAALVDLCLALFNASEFVYVD